MMMNSPVPTASGNHPPAATLTRFAEKNDTSMMTSGMYSASAAPSDHRQLRTATRKNRNDVIVMVPVTAMPYAAARPELEPNASTSATHATISIQLISGM